MVDIHELMNRFNKIPNTTVNTSYRHPTHPASYLQAQVKEFFDKYPSLKRDTDYVDFMEAYAGASLDHPDLEITLQIYGLASDAIVNVLHPDESLISEGRYFRFAEIGIEPPEDRKASLGISFAFDMNSENLEICRRLVPFGHYERDIPCQFYCNSFAEWLERLVDSSGYLTN